MFFVHRLGLCATLLTPLALIAKSIPSGEAVMDNYFEATGGHAAFDRQHTMVRKGSIESTPSGLKGSITVSDAEPGLSLEEIEVKGLGKMTSGCDGKVAWSNNAMQGPRVLEGEEKACAIDDAIFHNENWREVYKEVQNLGNVTIDGRQCYKLRKTPNHGKPFITYYDTKTCLPVKSVAPEVVAVGENQTEMIRSDWRRVEGTLLPYKSVSKTGIEVTTTIFESIQINATLPKERFDPPAEVKALVDKKK